MLSRSTTYTLPVTRLICYSLQPVDTFSLCTSVQQPQQDCRQHLQVCIVEADMMLDAPVCGRS